MGDQYSWTGSGDGTSWSDPNNWADATTGTNPATSAPVSSSDVTIASATTITGPGSADNLYVNPDPSNPNVSTVFGGTIQAVNAYITTNLSITGGLDTSTFISIADLQTTIQSSATLHASGPSGTLAALQVDGFGTLDVDGGTLAVSVGGGIVGYASDGYLTIENAGSATLAQSDSSRAALTIGFENSSYGQVTVTGVGSSLTTSTSGINLGYNGFGELYVQDGATVTAVGIDIGDEAGGSGDLEVSDSGSTFTVQTGVFNIGYSGGGSVEVSGGGTISDQDATNGLVIASQEYSSGDLS